MTTADILIENQRRLGEIKCEYNPLTGVGSLIPRYEFKIDEKNAIYLPESMQDERSLISGGNMRDTVSNFDEALLFLFQERIKYDFEFWAATCATIQDKEDKSLKKLTPRLPQRILLAELIDLFWKQAPIEIIIVKARQWGGSTLVQLFMAWLQLFHFENWHSAIVGDVEDQAKVIRGMYSRMAQHHPEAVQKITFAPFERSTKNRIMLERGCIVSIGSMQKPEGLRSSDIMMVHKSEVASWKATEGKKPEDIIQALSGIPRVHGAVDIEESTGKGVGGYFHKSWTAAVEGKNNKRPVFIPWFKIDMYLSGFDSEEEKTKLAETLDDYGQFLWEQGATLEGIKWYFEKRKTITRNDPSENWRMQAEYPTTPDESFQTTGRRAFSPLYVKKAAANNIDPEFVGEIFPKATGKEAFKGIEFTSTPNGDLYVWEMPDNSQKIKYRYVVPVDIGGRTEKADFSVIRVLDRLPLIQGGVPVYVLTWMGHLDQDLVVWKAAQIAWSYQKGLLVPESNSLDTEQSEGDHFITVLDEIKDFYPNIFSRTDPKKVREGAPVQYGFHTNNKSKPDLITNVNKMLREGGYVEYDRRVIHQYNCYEIKPDGTYGNVDGEHDDLVMCSAIGLKVSELMPLPVIIDGSKPHRATREIISAATI